MKKALKPLPSLLPECLLLLPAPTPMQYFHANHPFLYLITESSTGAVLFAGRYCGE